MGPARIELASHPVWKFPQGCSLPLADGSVVMGFFESLGFFLIKFAFLINYIKGRLIRNCFMSVSEATVLTDIVSRLFNPSLPDVSRAAKDELSSYMAQASFYRFGSGNIEPDANELFEHCKARVKVLSGINQSVIARAAKNPPVYLTFESVENAKFYVLNCLSRIELFDVKNNKLIEDALLHFCQQEIYDLHNECYSKIHQVKSRKEGARKIIRNWRYEKRQRALLDKGIVLAYGCPDFEVAFCDDENDVQFKCREISEVLMVYRPWGDVRFDYRPPWLVEDKVE